LFIVVLPERSTAAMPDEKKPRKPRPPRAPKDSSLRYKMYRYRLYPTRKQVGTLEWILCRCKEIYNAALEERTAAYRMCGVSVTFQMQDAQLPEIKEERPEFQEIYSQVLQDVLHRIDKAMQNFFRRIKNGEVPGYPRFKSGSRYHSFTYPQSGYEVIGMPKTLKKNEKKTCKLALSKIGHLKMIVHRPIQGTIKTCSIKRDGDHWYACFSVEYPFDPTMAFHPSPEEVGIDLGLKSYAVLSNGVVIDNPRLYRATEEQIKQAHKKLSRGTRGSHRRNRAKRELSRLYRKTRHRRQDFLHKTSRRLVNSYGTLVFEDLQIKNMSATPKPKKDEETGTFLPNGAAAKGGLNKSILDAAWGTLTRLCASKAEEAGCTVVKVNPRNTTQACSGCGSLVPKDLTVRWHACPECGCAMDRDENAARNILYRYKHPEAPLAGVKREKKPRTPKKSTGAGSVPQPHGEERTSPGDCRSPCFKRRVLHIHA
jgi:putative transposase